VLDVVLRDPDLAELARALVAAEVANIFASSNGFFTLFAPTNAAFQSLPANITKFFSPPWKLHLQNLLLFHATTDRNVALTDGRLVRMLDDETTTVKVASSGAVTLVSRFTKSARVAEGRTNATNGVVYKIDSLLLASFTGLNIFDVLLETENLSILASLLRAADLEGALRTGAITLLAPVNAAFEALTEADLRFLRDPDNRNALRSFLSYHIVNALVPSTDLLQASTITNILGSTITIVVDQDGILLNARARVQRVDRLASNGIVHSIGSVLIPPPRVRV
jgi:transforming growth factor-beta-induced protein